MTETKPNPELLLNLGKYIQNARDAQGLTQEKVGEVIGRAGKSVSNIECGRTNPKYDTLYAIFRALNVDVNGLFYGGHDENSSTLEEFLNLLDSCTEKELKMLLDISRIILATTRSNSEIGELETV